MARLAVPVGPGPPGPIQASRHLLLYRADGRILRHRCWEVRTDVLLKRLVQMARAHLSDLWERPWPQTPPRTSGTGDPPPFETPFTDNAFEAGTPGLPYSAELAAAYSALDLPFGTSLERATRRWKTYLKKCHPDRYATEPDKLADATQLTQELTRAYETIKAAWAETSRPDSPSP